MAADRPQLIQRLVAIFLKRSRCSGACRVEGASVWSCKGLVIQLRLCQRATILQSSVWRQKSRGEFDSMLWASAARASCTGDLRVDSAGDRWLDPVGGHLLRFFYDEGNTRAKRDNRSVDRPNVCGWQSLDRLTQKKKIHCRRPWPAEIFRRFSWR